MIDAESKLVLTLRGVRLVRGGGKEQGVRNVLDGIDLHAYAGEALFLVGPNGAGKTTLLHVCAGVIEPTGGEVLLPRLGSPSLPRVRRTIGFVPQTLAIYPQLTVQENLVFFGQMMGVAPDRLREAVQGGLTLSGLLERARDRAATLSGGMQRRLSFACAVMHEPKLLLLDEPTAGVDADSREHLYEAIEGMKARGAAIVCSTHSPDEAERLADRMLKMVGGRVIEDCVCVPRATREFAIDRPAASRFVSEELC